MSRRRELARRLGALGDIAGILSAMRGLSLMEIRALEDSLPAQRRMLDTIEQAAADVLATRPAPDLAETGPAICILVGSEQGFCGDFNDVLLAGWQARAPAAGMAYLSVGQRLASRLGTSAQPLLELAGASLADEVPKVLLRLTAALSELAATPAWRGHCLSALHHDAEPGRLRLRQLLPMQPALAPVRRAYPPDVTLPLPRLLQGLTRHYLHAALNQVLYSSLLAENRQRHAHMQTALNRLDEDRDRLRLAYNAQRQEDITEEIEVILLSAGIPADA